MSLRNRQKTSLLQAFLPCFAASADELYIFRKYAHIIFILQYSNSTKTTRKLSKNEQKQSFSIISSVKSAIILLPCHIIALKMNQAPEQNKILVSSQCNLTAQIEQVHDNLFYYYKQQGSSGHILDPSFHIVVFPKGQINVW